MKIFFSDYSNKFRQNRRGWYSFIILSYIFMLTLFAEFIANDKPLLIYYKNTFYCPIFHQYQDNDFGGTLPIPANFKDPLTASSIQKNGWMIWPLIPFDPESIDDYFAASPPNKPSFCHWLGTDDQGRDVLTRIIYGVRSTLIFSLLLTILSGAIGICIGGIQGYFGGKIDLIGQRLVEIWSSIPILITLMVISNIMEFNFWRLLGMMVIFKWMRFVPIIRAEFLRARNLNYVQAAKAMGVHPFTIMMRHILPNIISAPLSLLPFILSSAIGMLATLEFLGFSLPSSFPSLGEIIYQGKNNLHAPWIILSGFTVLSTILILIIFMGEGLRDAFRYNHQQDPQLL